MATTKRKGNITFNDYLADAASLDQDSFLGALLWFTITKKSKVTREELVRRFTALGLDDRFVPNPIRPVDAFKKATGPESGECHYRLADGHEAKAFVRHVTQDRDTITRHLIRERIDARGRHLDYEHVGDLIFYKAAKGAPGTERVRYALHDGRLQDGERPALEKVITEINDNFETYKNFLYDQPLRVMVRQYILALNAVSVRPSGGMYFVHKTRWDTLRKISDLVEGLHDGCTFTISPLADLPNLRDMVIEAFQEEAENSVTELVTEIEEKRKAGTKITSDLLDRYSKAVKDIQTKAEEHSRILNVSQDKTANALEIAYVTLAALATEVMG